MSSFMSKNTFQITLYIQYSDKHIFLPTGKLTKKGQARRQVRGRGDEQGHKGASKSRRVVPR